MNDRVVAGPHWLRLSAIAGFAVFAAMAGAAQTTPPPLKIFGLGPPQLKPEQVGRIVGQFGLQERRSESGAPTGVFEAADGSVRGILIGNANNLIGFYLSTDMRNRTKPAPLAADAAKLAAQFVTDNGLLVRGETWRGTEPQVWTRQGKATPTGEPGASLDAVRTLKWRRVVDNIPMYGPASMINVNVDSSGVSGFTHVVRSLVPMPDFQPIPKSNGQLADELELRMMAFAHGDTANVISKRLVYFEQGQKFVQPCWLHNVQATDKNGFRRVATFLIPAVQNSPEDITEYETHDFPPIFPERPALRNVAEMPRAPSANVAALLEPVAIDEDYCQASPVQIGEYIVRNDHHCWLDDAKNFWRTATLGRALSPWHPPLNRRDYWWNRVFCWHNDPAFGGADLSSSYVGQDHFALIEGHGAPWIITTLGNGSDIVHVNQLDGFGGNRPGQKTSYIQWQSCDVIPQPGHPYEWDFASGTAFDVWWNVMKGMRGNYGYRTLMHICNGVSGSFGLKLGFGFQNLSAWLDSTDNGVFGHLDGLDYGSAVILSGREGDTLYNNNVQPNASSTGLTMWWIHA